MKTYSPIFYHTIHNGSLKSAEEIVPLVLELLQPNSVVDVGCGVGTWLSVFRKHGIENILGIDGPWVNKEMLLIPHENFLHSDLSKPQRINKQFDLVVSLEVAEHLPQEAAQDFVDSLVRLGSVILFSAAIPGQVGFQHINEQWPEYWAKLFNRRGYAVIDCIRKMIWQNPKIECYYAQNILIFAKSDFIADNPRLKAAFEQTNLNMLSLVHPNLLSNARDPHQLSLRKVLPVLPSLLRKSLVDKIKKLQSLNIAAVRYMIRKKGQ